MIVLDACAIVEMVLDTARGALVAQRLRGEDLHAPQHMVIEGASALRRAMLRGLISERDADIAVADLLSVPVQRWDVMALFDRAWSLNRTHSFQDALYVALAEGTGSPLITCDARLGRTVGHSASVEVL